MAFKKGQSGNLKGRPKGTPNSPRLSNYISEAERKKFVEFILDTYMGDMRLAAWLGDHLFMKPTVGDKDNPLVFQQITGMKVIKE